MKLKDLWYSVYDFCSLVWSFIGRVVNYLPVLWKDRDFDHAFILLLLKHKLKRTRLHITQHQVIESANEVGAQIQHTENLIDRILNNDYCADDQLVHDTKWGEVIQYFDPKEPGATYVRMNIVRANTTTSELQAQERVEQRIIYEAMDKALEKDWNDLFDYMKANMTGWWD